MASAATCSLRVSPRRHPGRIQLLAGPRQVGKTTLLLEAADLRGIAEFTRRHRGYRPMVLCDAAQRGAVELLSVEAQAWTDFLLEPRRDAVLRRRSGG